jgi:trimeric autotransporter adhesin
VTLIVNNGYFSDTLIMLDYMTVTDQPGAPSISANGFELTSNVSTGNQWYFEGNIIPGANGQNYTADQTGIYWDVIMQNGCSSDTSNHIYVVMTGMEPPTGPQFTISPVPNNGLFQTRVISPAEATGTIQVINILGAEVYFSKLNLKKGDNSIKVDIRSCPAGVYFVVLGNGVGSVVRQMVKL